MLRVQFFLFPFDAIFWRRYFRGNILNDAFFQDKRVQSVFFILSWRNIYICARYTYVNRTMKQHRWSSISRRGRIVELQFHRPRRMRAVFYFRSDRPRRRWTDTRECRLTACTKKKLRYLFYDQPLRSSVVDKWERKGREQWARVKDTRGARRTG